RGPPGLRRGGRRRGAAGRGGEPAPRRRGRLRAALELRRIHPGTALLVLSQYIETRYATQLLHGSPAGVGYLLALMAEGRSNPGVAAALVLTLGTVEKHVASIFGKLGLPAS